MKTVLAILAVIFLLGVFILQPYLEARTFNKFRKEESIKATYIDAVFSNLRITP